MIRCVIFDIDNTLYDYTKANPGGSAVTHNRLIRFQNLLEKIFLYRERIT